jgi:hypothetical protein
MEGKDGAIPGELNTFKWLLGLLTQFLGQQQQPLLTVDPSPAHITQQTIPVAVTNQPTTTPLPNTELTASQIAQAALLFTQGANAERLAKSVHYVTPNQVRVTGNLQAAFLKKQQNKQQQAGRLVAARLLGGAAAPEPVAQKLSIGIRLSVILMNKTHTVRRVSFSFIPDHYPY